MSAQEPEPSKQDSNSQRGQAAPSQRARKKRFYGWNIVAASALTNGFGGSVHWQGFTVFFIPISQSLGLSSAQTAMPFALSRAENGILGPITGVLLDKYGVRRMMIFGTVMTGVGYIWLAQTSTYLAFLLVYLFVVSIGSSTSFMQASTSALNTWFSRRRGMVMSINSAAFRLGGAFMVNMFLSFAATNEFRISVLKIGPTEARIFFVAVNTAIIVFGSGWVELTLPFVAAGLAVALIFLVYRTQKQIWKIDMDLKQARLRVSGEDQVSVASPNMVKDRQPARLLRNRKPAPTT